MSDISNAFDRVIAQLAKHNQPVSALRPGLTDAQINTLTENYPFQLPREVRELYRHCNGAEPVPVPNAFIVGSMQDVMFTPDCRMLSLEEAMREYQQTDWASETEMVAAGVVNPRWLSIFGVADGSYYMVLGDERERPTSRVIAMTWEEPQVAVAARTLCDFLLAIEECWQTGVYWIDAASEQLEIDYDREQSVFAKYGGQDHWDFCTL